MNLIINASEAIGTKQGTIDISTRVITVLESDLTRWMHTEGNIKPGDFVQLEVKDDGLGMPPETLAKIFDPFFTTKFTGRGLGLSAVLGIVRGHSGGLQVESEAKKGTIFRIIFPALEVSSAQKAITASTEQAFTTSMMVLVIDDEIDVRNVIVDMLHDANIHSLTASDGESGIALYKEHRHEIGLVLLDLSMPGIDGKETFRRLKKIDPNAKVVMSSGFSESEVTHEIDNMGLTGFIQKPYRWDVFIELLKGFLQV
jgi:CheY-like chemotaxis protein